MIFSAPIIAGILLAASARADRLDASNKRATTVCVQPDRDVWFKRKPRCSAMVSRAGSKVLMSYNGQGLRDKDYPAKAPHGVTRILLIGGSLMTAPGVVEPETPPRVLEALLRVHSPKVEVINASGEGYTTWENAVRLQEYVDAYHPKIVIFHLAAHYLFTDRSLWPDMRRQGSQVLGFRHISLPKWYERIVGLLRRNPRYAYFLARIYREQWDRILASREISAAPADRGLDNLLGPTVNEFAQMAAVCRSSSAKLYIVYDGEDATADQYLLVGGPAWPGRLAQALMIHSLRFDGAEVTRKFVAAGARDGYAVLSIDPVRAALHDSANRLSDDYHWNARGARIFAQAVADVMQAMKVGR